MRWLSFRVAYFEGRDFLEKERFVEAESRFEKAFHLCPYHPDATLALAQSKWKLDRKGEARKLVADLLERDPGLPPAHFLLGIFFSDEKMWEEAAAELEKSVEADPKNIEAWYELGKVYLRLHQDLKALHAFHLVAQSDPFVLHLRLSEFPFSAVEKNRNS